MNVHARIWVAGALLCLPCAGAFGQQGAVPVPVATAQAATISDSASVRPADARATSAAPVAGMGIPLNAVALDHHRGGDSSVDNGIWTDGTVSDTSATNVATGSNAIGGGAFANTSGIATVIQNSGANVLIQNATIVNVQFTSP